MTCWDGMIEKSSRCNDYNDCSYGEDEFLCGQRSFEYTFYRAAKYNLVHRKQKNVKLFRFPSHSNSGQNISANVGGSTPSTEVIRISLNLTSLLNWCNRGIPIWTPNGSRACFCPPQYHGDQCQFHSDRITLFIKTKYTHSEYTTYTDPSVVHKFLVLFFSDSEVISVDEFHIQPATEMSNHRKKVIYLHYSRSMQHMQKKRDRYFNRSSIVNDHPFFIRIEAYELKGNLRPRRFAVWRYPIYFDFLPVYRLATILRFLPSSEDDPCRKDPCGRNEECYRVQNLGSQHLCLCKNGFFGDNCSLAGAECGSGYCSPNAVCRSRNQGLINVHDVPYCVCPYGHIGQRCELLPDMCLENPCKNGGQCIPSTKPNEYTCLCADEYQGKICEKTKPSIHLQLHHNATVSYQVIVVQYLKINFVTLEVNITGQKVYARLPHSISYFYYTSPVPEIVLLKLYLAERSDIHILSLLMDQTSIRTNTSITEHNRCKPAQSFFATNEHSVIKYHHVCRTHPELLCFFDEIYICICEEDHSRAECFNYDHSKDTCDRCLVNGRCVKGRHENDFRCMCPACHEGRFCHFNLESVPITLDQLFSPNLLSLSPFISNATYYLLIIIPLLVFLVGLVNNLCAFVTFRRPRCLRNGIGHYLFAMSICNQLTLAFLALRLIHLAVNISASYQSFTLDGILCKVSNYLLTASTRLIYWLSTLVAIERVYVALFINGQWLNKPRIARRIIALTVVTILGVSAYQLLVTHLPIDRDDVNNVLCSVTFPASSSNWLRPRGPVAVIDSVGPFLINLVCTVSIICLVTKKKMNATRGRDTHSPHATVPVRQNRLHLLRTVLAENKELVIGPAFTLLPQLFSLPYFVASLMLQCSDLQRTGLRYLLMVSYFTAFIPPLTSFLLYISPSTFYSQEWQATSIGKWLMSFKQRRQEPTATMNTNGTVGQTR